MFDKRPTIVIKSAHENNPEKTDRRMWDNPDEEIDGCTFFYEKAGHLLPEKKSQKKKVLQRSSQMKKELEAKDRVSQESQPSRCRRQII